MDIIEPGHIYRLNWLDGEPQDVIPPDYGDALVAADGQGPTQADLVFVNREDNPHAGTQTQEVLRALIDRTMHCDNCLRWPGNDDIIYHLRMALVLHEARALGRKVEKGELKPEQMATGGDGHFVVTGAETISDDAVAYAARAVTLPEAQEYIKEFIGPGHATAPERSQP